MPGLPSRIPCLKPGIRSRKTVLGTKVFDEFEMLTSFCVLYSRSSSVCVVSERGKLCNIHVCTWELERRLSLFDRWFFNVIKIEDRDSNNKKFNDNGDKLVSRSFRIIFRKFYFSLELVLFLMGKLM